MTYGTASESVADDELSRQVTITKFILGRLTAHLVENHA